MYLKRIVFFVVLIMMFSACGESSSARSLTGTWHGEPSMVAHISKGKIRIDFVEKNTKYLYWKGTFNTSITNGEKTISKGDTEAMDSSLLGSQDSTKKFLYKGGKLFFTFRIMGTSRTVRLSR